jgi:hypothetical protein
MEFKVDTRHEQRSFRIGKKVHSIKLESFWWTKLEKVLGKDGPVPELANENLRNWMRIWIEDAEALGCSTSQLVRIRIHQLCLDELEPQGPVLPALAHLIGSREAKQTECPYHEIRGRSTCRATNCRYWQKSKHYYGMGYCKRLADDLQRA